MSVKTRLKLLVLCLIICSLSLIAGCIGEQTADDFLAEKNALNQVVTYYANGGYFGTDKTVKNMHYQPDSPVVEDWSATSAKIQLTRSGYVFDAWYYALVDEDNNPIYDENGNLQITDEKVDFSRRIQENEHWYICAGWVADVRVEYVLISENEEDVTATDGTVYKYGEVFDTQNFGTNGTVSVSDSKGRFTSTSDFTFVQYYTDIECTQPISGTVKKPTGEGAQSVTLYAKYIKGEWKVVRSASDVVSMFANLASGNKYYFSGTSTTKSIDMKGKGVTLSYGDECNVTIQGNGYTLTNLTYTATGVSSEYELSIFGTLSEKTVISDLTISNVTFTASVRSSTSIYMFCSQIASAPSFTNVVIEGVTMTITHPSTVDIYNIPSVNGEYVTTNWMFGGATSDEAFLSENSGLTITGATLNI